ncbi:unnamed protein product [Arabidopsis thaliana]|uniref:GH18 domain-containing protein n=1 Tax=Arabidopsis thaliana TaxID=3702 RepID=A0A654FQX9_ARATH|nr:unnamed protein product [Arabidopsis thaliana]
MSPSVVKASYWSPSDDFPAIEIDSNLFTHLFCAFADLDSDLNEITIAESNQSDFKDFTRTVQRENYQVKTLLSIGGGNANKDAFASMASSSYGRKSFILSTISIARSYGFDGLDLDWEYPRNAAEMSDFAELLKEWRYAVQGEAYSSELPVLILTATVYYSSNYNGVVYPVKFISELLDWVNLKAYDFYGPGCTEVTGPPAALYLQSDGPSGDSGVKDWIDAGLPAEKAVLGFPYYGWAWTLADPKNHGYYVDTTGPAISDDGEISYSQLKTWIVDNKATTVHDNIVIGDYCYAGTTWIGYDSEESIVTKVIYAKQKGLLGYFSWQVGGDDKSELSSAASDAWDNTEKE